MKYDFLIWVDADACPQLVREFLLKESKEKCFCIKFVANAPLPLPIEKNPLIEMIICSNEKDAADNYILSHCKENDIIITKDLLLAQKLLEKPVTVINDRGMIFTEEVLKNMLEERALSLQYSQLGILPKKKRYSYGQKELSKFIDLFTSLTSAKQE